MVVGMLWVQGGADAKKESCANAYSKNLAALIAAARKDFGNPKMFFVVAQTHMHLDERKEKFSFLSAVRKAQASCRAENYGFVVCDDLERGPDKIHFNTRGLVGLGKLLAEKMGALVKGK